MSADRQQILADAAAIVSADRNLDYGEPEDNFTRIAEFWTAYLGFGVAPHDVAVMMVLLKAARIRRSPGKQDHWVDMAGYAACGGETAVQ